MQIKKILSYFLSIQLWMSSITSVFALMPRFVYADNMVKKVNESSADRRVFANNEKVLELIVDIDNLKEKIQTVKIEIANDIYSHRNNGGYIADLGDKNRVNSFQYLKEDALNIKSRIEVFLNLDPSESEEAQLIGPEAKTEEEKRDVELLFTFLKLKLLNYFLNNTVRLYREIYMMNFIQENVTGFNIRDIDELLPSFEIYADADFRKIISISMMYLNGQTEKELSNKDERLIEKYNKSDSRKFKPRNHMIKKKIKTKQRGCHNGLVGSRLPKCVDNFNDLAKVEKVDVVSDKEDESDLPTIIESQSEKDAKKDRKEYSLLVDSINNLELQDKDQMTTSLLNLRGVAISPESRTLFNMKQHAEGRLKYQVVFGLERPIFDDILSLGKVNTAFTYLSSLKWLTAIKIKNEIIKYSKLYPDADEEIEIPTSCHYENGGHFPETIQNELIDDKKRYLLLSKYLHSNGLIYDEKFIESQIIEACANKDPLMTKIKANNQDEFDLASSMTRDFCKKKYALRPGESIESLIVKDDDFNHVMSGDLRTLYRDVFLAQSDLTPLFPGFSGILPYENYSNAVHSRSYLSDDSDYKNEVGFDDITDYDSIMRVKKSLIENIFKSGGKETARDRVLNKGSFQKDKEALQEALQEAIMKAIDIKNILYVDLKKNLERDKKILLEDMKNLENEILQTRLELKYAIKDDDDEKIQEVKLEAQNIVKKMRVVQSELLEIRKEQLRREQAAMDIEEEAKGKEFLFTSPFLYDLMQKEDTKSWKKLLTESETQELKRSKIQIKFPPFFGSNLWRGWALALLKRSLVEYRDSGSKYLYSTLIETCNQYDNRYGRNSERIKFCESKNTGYYKKEWADEIVGNMIGFLTQFDDDGVFLPSIASSNKMMVQSYSYLRVIWDKLLPHSELIKEQVYMSEFDFIKNAIEDRNPFAMLKVSFIKLENTASEIVSDEYWSRYGKRIIQKVKKILGMHKALTPGFGSQIVSRGEAQIIFEAIKEDLDKKTEHLLSIPLNEEILQIKRSYFFSHAIDFNKEKDLITYFDIVGGAASRSYISKSSYKSAMAELDLSPTAIDAESIEQIFSTNLVMTSGALERFMKSRGKPYEYKVELLEEIQKNNPNFRYEDFEIKKIFFDTDNFLKGVVLRALVSKIAKVKVEKLKELFTGLCDRSASIVDKSVWKVFGLFGDNMDEVRGLYAISRKSQEELEKSLSIKPPEEIENYVSSMSNDEAEALSSGLYSAVAIMSGAAFLGLATACAISGIGIFICGAGTIAGMGAMGLGLKLQIEAQVLERQDLIERGDSQVELTRYYHHGLLDRSTVEELEKGPFAMGLEAAFIIPVLGALSRAIYIGVKSTSILAKTAGKQAVHLLRSTPKVLSKESAFAYKDWKDEARRIFIDGRDQMKLSNMEYQTLKSLEIAGLKKWNPIDEMAMYSKDSIDIPFTQAQIRDSWAKNFATQIGGASKLKNIYSRHLNRMGKYRKSRDYRKEFRLKRKDEARNEALSKGKFFNEKSYSPGFFERRSSSIIKYESRMKQMVKELDDINDYDVERLARFIRKYDMSIVKMIKDMPLRPREFMYMMLSQGSPMLHRRLPFHGPIAQGAVMKRFAASFDTLVSQSVKRAVQEGFHKSTKVISKIDYHPNQDGRVGVRMIHRLARPLSNFMEGIEHAIKVSSNPKNQKALNESYKSYKKEVSKDIADFAKAKWNYEKSGQYIISSLNAGYKIRWDILRNLTPTKVEKLIFSKSLSYDEAAIREYLLNAIPRDKFFENKGFSKISFLAHKQLEGRINSSSESLQRYLDIMKLEWIKSTPMKIDFF